ncbi:MAG: type II secretion system protein [bacterium]|nr:type II secretion system protein [bacterium]
MINLKIKSAFTLAEVLITLAIIGVVAAVSIPSVISNSQQQEFKTGLRKAVSVLNSAITMNMALDGETPYDNGNLFGFFMKHMSIIRSTSDLRTIFTTEAQEDTGNSMLNAAFYTTDGMRFEFRAGATYYGKPLYENAEIQACMQNMARLSKNSCGGCGSLGLNNNTDNTTKPPCLIMVDVNGDKKPNPANINCAFSSENTNWRECAKPYKYSDPDGKKLTDLFTIMITDKEAIPYGVAAQRAMYNSRQ